MGLLLTTEGQKRILDTLNTAFDGPGKGLAVIQSFADPKSSNYNQKFYNKISGRNWPSAHLARMLLLLPFDQSTSPGLLNNSDTKRWHYFLKKILGPSVAMQQIRDALADAILNQNVNGVTLNIVRVVFSWSDVPVPYPVVQYDSTISGGGTVRHIQLFTIPVPSSEPGTRFEPKPGDAPNDYDNAPWRTDPNPWDKP